MERKYFKPRSLTWWAGIGLITMGLIVGLGQGFDIGGITAAIEAWTGGIGSAALMAQGAGLIGLRGALNPPSNSKAIGHQKPPSSSEAVGHQKPPSSSEAVGHQRS